MGPPQYPLFSSSNYKTKKLPAITIPQPVLGRKRVGQRLWWCARVWHVVAMAGRGTRPPRYFVSPRHAGVGPAC
jgi:hypothetical protein